MENKTKIIVDHLINVKGEKEMGNGKIPRIFIMLVIWLLILAAISVTALVYLTTEITTSPTAEATETSLDFLYKAIAMLSIGIAFGLATLAAGIGIAVAGSAAISAAAEKPELSTLAMIITGLAEAIAIYGLVVVIMMLGKI
ncbi:MAG: ATPase [Thermofilum sp. ex4484_79]|nr:MAG: ATPase [Thermofilum sp. ex4484_79]